MIEDYSKYQISYACKDLTDKECKEKIIETTKTIVRKYESLYQEIKIDGEPTIDKKEKYKYNKEDFVGTYVDKWGNKYKLNKDGTYEVKYRDYDGTLNKQKTTWYIKNDDNIVLVKTNYKLNSELGIEEVEYSTKEECKNSEIFKELQKYLHKPVCKVNKQEDHLIIISKDEIKGGLSSLKKES